MGTSRVFVFIRRRTVSGARTVRFVCYEYCQNGCQNEIWNGSLKAVARISNNHLVYEYHDGYIYHNSLAVSWYIASPMQTTSWLCCNALAKIDIGTLSANETKPNQTERNRRHAKEKRKTRGETNVHVHNLQEEEKFQPSVSMEMFYLFSIILFPHA